MLYNLSREGVLDGCFPLFELLAAVLRKQFSL